MKIVILDGYTLNPGDLSWQPLEAFGTVDVYDRTPDSQILARAEGAEVLLTNKTPLFEETLKALDTLRYIGVLATGYNVVDVSTASDRGIVVTNVPSYGTSAVAQMVFALLLELCHHVQHHSNEVKKGRWSEGPDFCFWDFPLVELAGKSMGIVGFGRIGRQVASIAAAMGMRVIANDPLATNPPDYPGFAFVSKDELFETADVISLNCLLTDENRGMINKDVLKRMKTSAFLINASRGGLIVDADLADALNRGEIAGAGLDVLGDSEPPAADNPMLSAPNCVITPHIAWAAHESRARLLNTAIENVRAFLDGKPQNVITP
jgi:glycerate dehydrogenase